MDLPKRIVEKFAVNAQSGCWEWTGATANKQDKWVYGILSVGGRLKMAHRVVWELVRGQIPKKMQLDHLCRNTRCVNPAHLEIVNAKENIRRGNAARGRKKVCVNGHELTGANVYDGPDGRRECVLCRKNDWVAYRERHGLDYVSPQERRMRFKNAVWIEFNGEKLPLAEWAERLGIKRKTLTTRLKAGWTVEDAFTKQVRK